MFQKNSSISVLIFAFVFASSAYAGKVELTTYYPSPYGEYTTLTSTGNSSFATGGGQVSIGTATPAGKFRIDYGYDQVSPRADHIYLSDPNNGLMKGYIGLNRNTAAGADKEYLGIEAVEETVHWMPIVLAAEGGNVGIGTTTPAERLEVNGNAKITGTSFFGLEVITNSCTDTNRIGANCSVTTTCPIGKKIVGGGCNTTPGVGQTQHHATINANYPISDTQWVCTAAAAHEAATDDITVIGSAICARVGN